MANVQSTTSNLADRAVGSAGEIYKSAKNATGEVSNTVTTEFRNLISDVEEFLKKIGTGASSNFADARVQVEQKLSTAKAQLASAQQTARDKVGSGMRVTEDYVQTHPWQTIGLAVAIGVVIGLLASRDDD